MAHKTPTRGDYRKFGLFLAALFIAAGLLPLLRGGAVRLWPEAVGAALAAVALAVPAAIRPVYRLSLKAGGVLGWINTRILLGALFFLVFTPTGLVLRLLRGRAFSWPNRALQPTYWHFREKVDLREQMRHIF
jgi:hypothetical protein